MIQVTKEEYLKRFTNLDAICEIDTSKGFPYSTNWSLRGQRNIIARSEPIDNQGVERKYFIDKK